MDIYNKLSDPDKKLWVNTLNEISLLRATENHGGPSRHDSIEEHQKVIRDLIKKTEPKAEPT
jgi:hypothetical protein